MSMGQVSSLAGGAAAEVADVQLRGGAWLWSISWSAAWGSSLCPGCRRSDKHHRAFPWSRFLLQMCTVN